MALLFAPGVLAETPRLARARQLFEEARSLTQSGKFVFACPKFDASLELVPGVGTEFNLADCLEHVGQTERARELFEDVARKSIKAGQLERARVAGARAEALARPTTEPKAEAPVTSATEQRALAEVQLPELVVEGAEGERQRARPDTTLVPTELREECSDLAASAAKLQELRRSLTKLRAEQPNNARAKELAKELAVLEVGLEQAWQVAARAAAAAERKATWSAQSKRAGAAATPGPVAAPAAARVASRSQSE